MQPYKIFIVFLLVLLIAYSTIVLSNYEFNGSELKGNKPEEYKLEERFIPLVPL
ncbi:819_t:CDS:2 [Gigaspora rosea]|nr:819_t:CDS:2 [Gigaspora rosea]